MDITHTQEQGRDDWCVQCRILLWCECRNSKVQNDVRKERQERDQEEPVFSVCPGTRQREPDASDEALAPLNGR